jgi:hypothetical protein
MAARLKNTVILSLPKDLSLPWAAVVRSVVYFKPPPPPAGYWRSFGFAQDDIFFEARFARVSGPIVK